MDDCLFKPISLRELNASLASVTPDVGRLSPAMALT